MQLIDDVVVYSPSDITSYVTCQWAYVRRLESKLGKGNVIPPDNDPMMIYAAKNGNRHERYILSELQKQHGIDQVFIVDADTLDPLLSRKARLSALEEMTLSALEKRYPVVFQGAFFDGKYTGFSDFLVLNTIGDVEAYEVLDTKLALSDKKHVYDMQLASYVRHLKRLGIPVHKQARLIHGDLTESVFDTSVVDARLQLHLDLLDTVEAERRSTPEVTDWLSTEYAVCGSCASCQEQIDADPMDLLRVAGLGPAKRSVLIERGVTTMKELSQLTRSDVDGITVNTVSGLKEQAARQVSAHETDTAQLNVSNENPIRNLPEFADGDLYFDFETDPIFYVEGSNSLGIAYLFGIYAEGVGFPPTFVKHDPDFYYLWADNRLEEEVIFTDFMNFLVRHFDAHPNAHIFHYSPFEVTTLKQLSVKYKAFENEISELIDGEYFVDLKKTAAAAITHGLPGYSIKQLEPLYMGDELRTGTKNATASITRYDDYHQGLLGVESKTNESPADIKNDVLQYNRYDCYSMLRLRQWLESLLN